MLICFYGHVFKKERKNLFCHVPECSCARPLNETGPRMLGPDARAAWQEEGRRWEVVAERAVRAPPPNLMCTDGGGPPQPQGLPARGLVEVPPQIGSLSRWARRGSTHQRIHRKNCARDRRSRYRTFHFWKESCRPIRCRLASTPPARLPRFAEASRPPPVAPKP